MSLALRPARPTDAGKLGAMISDAVAADEWKPQLYSSAEDIAHLGDLIDRGWVNVCEMNGVVAGFVALSGESIHSLYVTGEAQGQGIGAALVQDVMSKSERLELWTFQANERAQRFYLKQGFNVVERTDGAGNDENLPDIKFAWSRKNKENQHG